MVSEIILGNFVLAISILLFSIMLHKNKLLDHRFNVVFLVAILLFVVLAISDSLDYYFSSFETLNNWRYVTSAIGYSFRPTILLLFIFILLRNENKKHLRLYFSIPLIINVALCITSPFTHWVFYFVQETNSFKRGPIPLCYLPFIVSGIYLVAIIVLTILESKYIGTREIILISAIAVSITGATITELFTDLRFLLNGTGIICCVFYYMYFLSQAYQRDPLTELLNRKAFYNDSSDLAGRAAIICIDMNNLKKLNDEKGHSEGDHALAYIARSIASSLSSGDKAYRIGGDEFVIISKKKPTSEAVDALMNTINGKVTEGGFSIASGYEFFEPDDDFNKVYIAADKKMYQCKRQMKRASLK